jgi:hypothetical protein
MMNYDTMTRGAILKRLEAIKEGYRQEFLAGNINAEQLANLNAQVYSSIDKFNGNNVFSRITTSIKAYRAEVQLLGKDSEGAKNKQKEMFAAISEGAESSGQIIGQLANSFQELGIGGQGLQDTLKNIGGIIQGNAQIAKGIASGNPVDIVTGSIQLLTSAISLFNTKDKNLQKKIDGYKRELDALGRSYADLDRAVRNAAGNDIYADQAAQIENLRQQQAKLIQMRDAEDDKKKTDAAKVQELQNQIDSIPGQIDDINQAISANLIQGTFRELSNSLADALTSAFQAGEDGIAAMDKSLDQFIANAIKNSLKLTFFDKDIKQFTDDLTSYAKANKNSVEGFNFEEWRKIFKQDAENFNKGLEASKNIFKPGTADPDAATSLSGKISASLTEDTASRIYGVMAGIQLATVQTRDAVIPMGKTIGDIYQITIQNFQITLRIEKNTGRTADTLDANLPEMNATMKALLKNSGDSLSVQLRAAGKLGY